MHVTGPPRTWLRLEGAAVTVASLVAYHWQLANWWIFAAAFLLPDLSMLGYLAGPTLGARAYNLVHSYVGPIFLATYGIGIGRADVVPWALIWLAHIGFDRALGYGLKYDSAFQETHLGRIGRPGGATQGLKA
jgi:hypothetical protein